MNAEAIVHVVDDDPSVLRSLHRFLGASGLKVAAYPSAATFMARPAHDGPSCLVLDVNMPEISGPELQQNLSRTEPPIPIIFITGEADIPTCAEAMKLGAVDFLLKPFEQDVLLERIQQSLKISATQLTEDADRRKARAQLDLLTPREREVFELVVTGMLNKQIAAELGTCEKTVKTHRGRVTHKLGLNSVPALLLLAQAAGDSKPPNKP